MSSAADLVKGAVVAAIAAFSVKEIKDFTVETFEAADALAKTADKLGLTTDALQEYHYMAGQSGIATGTMEMAMQRFTRRVAEAAQGKGELKDTLEQYNIAVKDSSGRMRESEDVLDDLADVIHNTDNEAERLRIAFKAFDSEGAVMVNMLRDGSEGLNNMRNEARDLGLVIDEELLRNAEETNNEFDKLARVTSTASNSLPVNGVYIKNTVPSA